MKIGEKLAAARRAKNITQEQLADILGVSRQAVSRWESDLAYPETENLVRLSKILDVNCDYLLKDNVNEKGERTVEVKIVREVPARRQLNFAFIIMFVLIAAGAYMALAGTWNVVAELMKAAAARRETGILLAMGLCGALGYALIAAGAVILARCVKRKEYLFKKLSAE